MRLLDTTSRGGLTSGLGSQLLTGRLAAGGLASSLLSACHFTEFWLCLYKGALRDYIWFVRQLYGTVDSLRNCPLTLLHS